MGLRFFQSQYRVEWTLLMASSLIVLTPCIVLFFIAQKYYIQGIVITGVKG
jgi:multiple sugar transport system permease protein